MTNREAVPSGAHDTTPGAAADEIPVWDAFVRIVHWALVLAFAAAYLSGDEESALHVWSGYAVALLVTSRLVWGLIGTRHARFSDFVYRPAQVLAYARAVLKPHPPRYLGHNPLGGYMVIALLAAVAVTAVSGMALRDPADPFFGGAAAVSLPVPIAPARTDEDGRDDGAGGEDNEWLEEAHEFLANFTLALVLLHVAGVLWGSWRHRENLIRAMITGRKRANGI